MSAQIEVGNRATRIRLLLGDVDAIKTFVYETNALPEIRGGSEILLEIEEKIRNHLGDNLIYCGGGGFLAMVHDEGADDVKQEIERLYLNRTKTATITVVASDPIDRADLERGIHPHDEQIINQLQGRGVAQDLLFSHFEALVANRMDRKNFGEFIAQLTGKLQEVKRRKECVPFYESLPIHQRCQSCGKRAAVNRDEAREPAEWLCSVCLMKRQKGREERRGFLARFRSWAQREKGAERIGRIPQDLDTLAMGEGKIALIYADGNNMGDLLQRVESVERYRQISEALKVATEEALFAALWKTLGAQRLAQDPLPFEIIALGGDDVVVIAPASAGWALTVNLLKEFEGHPRIRGLSEGARLSMSAGLAIADVKYSVRFLFDLAEGLLKEAKRLAREKGTGTLCHLWLRAPVISENARAILDALYTRDDAVHHLTARPYTVTQAERLSSQAKELSHVPAAQRRALAEALEKGVHVSLNYALYQVARSKEHKERLLSVYRELGQLVDGRPIADGFWFWRRNANGWQTALLDVLELIELGAHKYPISEAGDERST
ncbi:MAG: phosphohydrolase [Blastocatellia bacterium]|nr:phosphohydrolase [Blastocatellia bacterium]MDW8166901.1 phosphohydrolase [Acidobacteriota bacterium]